MVLLWKETCVRLRWGAWQPMCRGHWRARSRTDAEAIPLATVEDVLVSRMRLLTAYQDERYAAPTAIFVNEVRRKGKSEQRHMTDGDTFVREVALTLARLMAYKDEYEVARLYTSPKFMQSDAATVRGEFQNHFPSWPRRYCQDAISPGSPKKARLRWLGSSRFPGSRCP